MDDQKIDLVALLFESQKEVLGWYLALRMADK
jgi:hypothetical protein